MGATANEFGISFQSDENVANVIVVLVTQFCEYPKDHWVVHFKWVSNMTCEFYPS